MAYCIELIFGCIGYSWKKLAEHIPIYHKLLFETLEYCQIRDVKLHDDVQVQMSQGSHMCVMGLRVYQYL